MPLTDADYRVRTSYPVDFLGAVFQNVWYFKRLQGADVAQILADGFINDFVPIIESILPDFVLSAVEVFAENLLDLDDIGSASALMEGSVASVESAQSFVSATFQVVRSTRQNKRHGRKAFGPLAEVMCNGNSPTLAYLPLLNAAAVSFGLDITQGPSRYRVAIPRSVKVANPNAPPDTVYEIQDLFPMERMVFTHISTQNSRKSF